MTTFVAGGTGFIGRRLIPLLVQRGEEIVVMDINPQTADYSAYGKQVRVVRGDVSQFDDFLARIVEAKPDRVVNLAYYIGSDLPPRVAFKLNVLGMDNCFEAARLAGVNRVVYASSVAVGANSRFYGERLVDEDRFKARPRAIRDAQNLQRMAGTGLPRKARHGDHDDPPGQCHRPRQDLRLGRSCLLRHQAGARRARRSCPTRTRCGRQSMSTRSPRFSPAW